MRKNRFDQIVSNLTAIARKVMDVIPTGEHWSAHQIYAELRRAGKTSCDFRVVEGCISSLVNQGIVHEGPRGQFQQVVPKTAEEPDSGDNDLSNSYTLKIGVIGLLPHQIADLRGRKIGRELECMESRVATRDRIITFCSHLDKVVVMGNTLTPALRNEIPKDKIVHVVGSISSLIARLEQLKEEQRKLQQDITTDIKPLAVPAKETNHKSDGAPCSTKEFIQISDIPTGLKSLYVPPSEPLSVQMPSAKGRMDYTAIQAAEKGDILRFGKPIGLKLSEWRQKINQTRHNYKTIHKIVTEAHFYQTYVDICVLQVPDVVKKPAPVKPVAPVTTVSVTQKAPSPQQDDGVKPLASDVPEGRRSQYLLPKHDILINYPNSGGVQDYSILRAAVVGDVIRFARPEGLSLPKWRNRVCSARHRQWNMYGMLLEAHFFNEYVDFQVMNQTDVVENTQALTFRRADMTVEREPSPHGTRDMGKLQYVIHPTDGLPLDAGEPVSPTATVIVEKPLFDSPQAEQSSEAAADPVPVEEETSVLTGPTMSDTGAAHRLLWSQVVVAAIGQHGKSDDAVRDADKVLAEFRTRFG